MLELDRFTADVCSILKRGISSNKDQYDIVTSPFGRCLKVVAGPGSGKTTVIVLRLLKMIYVDDVKPSEIIATTFTRKAASELKSRILRWGHLLQIHYTEDPTLSTEIRDRIRRLNFDLIVTGTVDSIAEDTMVRYRQPDENPPAIIDEFVSSQIMVAEYLRHFQDRDAINYELQSMGFDGRSIRNVQSIQKILMNIYLRASENEIDVNDLSDELPVTSKVLDGYINTLNERQFMDFPMLETRFLEYLSSDRSDEFVSGIRVLMVDEYQDTNLLQEDIYRTLSDRIVSSGGSVIFVGDDDQSIYRFRGSRVHLFADLEERFTSTCVRFDTVFLSVNYRSTPTIIRFCNDFISLDEDYQDVRVRSKPPMTVGRTDGGDLPIFAIFRDTKDELAKEIVRLVDDFSNKGSYTFHTRDGEEYVFERDPAGSAADAVLLMSSTKNVSSSPRLPFYISYEFEKMGSNLSVFNPRGNELADDPNVRILCGTILMCIDPESEVEMSLKLTKPVESTFFAWREDAKEYLETAPEVNGHRMQDLVDSWQTGKPYPRGGKWTKQEVGILDLVFNILTWMPNMRNDAESLVYLQAVCEAISNSILVKNQEVNLAFEKGSSIPKPAAVKNIYRRIFIPLAEGTMDIDEDLFFSVSLKDRFSIMTIHQAKGLEFPITIVDVSSDYEQDRSKNTRYPDKFDQTSIIEDLMRRHSDQIPADRDLLDGQYDDIIRKFFVAYSRAQDVLILVGLNRTFKNTKQVKPIKHMALGWDRHETWSWEGLPNVKFLR